MNLLSPLALLGLVGIAGILIAHRLGRAAPKHIAFAAVRFLRREQPAVARRREFSQIPLMLIRILMLAAAVIAVARPTTPGEPALAVLGKPHDAVLVLDTSASLELRVDGRSHSTRPVASAPEILDALPAGSRASLWVTHLPDAPLVAMTQTLGPIATAPAERCTAL